MIYDLTPHQGSASGPRWGFGPRPPYRLIILYFVICCRYSLSTVAPLAYQVQWEDQAKG